MQYQQRMVEHGQEVQSAVQLLSGAQARVFNLDLHKRMREIFKLSDLTKEMVEKLSGVMGRTNYAPGGMSEWYNGLKARVAQTDLPAALCVGLTSHLSDADGWEGKTTKLLDLLESESDPAVSADRKVA